jgi:zinc finger SWIM domain-containing protein 3
MSTPMLVQASKVYTPIIFEAFQSEYERSMAAYIKLLDGNKYVVVIGNLHGDLTFEDERLVIDDLLNQTTTSSCRMFERTGILWGHVLKVLDMMNIQTLTTHYILKRWTREAHKRTILDKQGRNTVEKSKTRSYASVQGSHNFILWNIKWHPLWNVVCC